MDWGGPFFVITIIAISTAGWLINNWIRAKHGYALEDEWGGQTEKADSAENAKLRAENKELHDKLDQVQDRMVVLERIVTDRGYSLSEEIEALRDTPSPDVSAQPTDSGIPLNLNNKEPQS